MSRIYTDSMMSRKEVIGVKLRLVGLVFIFIPFIDAFGFTDTMTIVSWGVAVLLMGVGLFLCPRKSLMKDKRNFSDIKYYWYSFIFHIVIIYEGYILAKLMVVRFSDVVNFSGFSFTSVALVMLGLVLLSLLLLILLFITYLDFNEWVSQK